MRLQLPSKSEDRAATSFQARSVYLGDTGLYCMHILAAELSENPAKQ